MLKLWKTIKMILCLLVSIFCFGYAAVCVIYAGIHVSWLFIWPLFGIFFAIRHRMLYKELRGKARLTFPLGIKLLYKACFLTFLCIFVFVESMVLSGMQTKPEENLPYVVVLGAGLRGNAPTRPLLLRMQAAAEYLTDNPDTIVIASGGQGSGESMSEAQCIYNYLVDKGIAPSRILLEDQSRNTVENIQNSFAMLPADTGRVGILSNGFHIYRATRIAVKQGYTNVCGIPSRTLYPLGLHYMVREFFAIIALEVFG